MGDTAIERQQGDALSRIVGTGDTRAMLEQVERNVKDVIDVARARGFVRKYGDGQHEFYGLPAWQLLGMTYGLVPFVEWSRQIDNGWEARAIVKTREGEAVGAAEAMCTRQEGNRRNAPDHTLRAMAQTRAQRNALRGCLGAALVLAGFDFADPEGAATKAQIGMLHQLERELGWPHAEAHEIAGVQSYKDLTREQAAELIDAWTEIRDEARQAEEKGASPTPSHSTSARPADPSGEGADTGEPSPPEEESSSGEEATASGKGGAKSPDEPPPDPDDDLPATDLQWSRVPPSATRVGLIKLAHRLVEEGRIPGPAPSSQAAFTRGQLAKTMLAYLDGERG